MSGFTQIHKGTVVIDHFSTASLIRIVFTHQEPNEHGVMNDIITDIWFEYSEFSDLKKAVT